MTLSNGSITITLAFTTPDLPLTHPYIHQLLDAVKTLHDATPLVTIGIHALDSATFKYEWDTVDGRKWKQRLDVGTGLNLMTFNGTAADYWDEGEFQPHRALRVLVFKLLRECTLHTLEASFT